MRTYGVGILGCGACVNTCRKNAISLVKKSNGTAPPETKQELCDIIMSNRKSRLGKAGMVGEIVVDAIRTGQIKLLG